MNQRALCVGINDYPGTDSDLAGCANDAADWAAALRKRGFELFSARPAGGTGRDDLGPRLVCGYSPEPPVAAVPPDAERLWIIGHASLEGPRMRKASLLQRRLSISSGESLVARREPR